jgi:L-ascorbate metabolism protein UlaG (beta-lactamase superfamily)
MKSIGPTILALTFALWTTECCSAAEPKDDSESPPSSVILKWLGNAGWEIQFGQTVILIDPFLTRGEANPTAEWKTDEEAVLKAIKRADFIFAGHSHADHIADVPFIAKKFGAKVIGSQTTTNIALTGGVGKSQLITIHGGEKLDFKDFSVQVIESEHGTLTIRGRKVRPKFEEITKPWSGPIMGNAFVEGGSYLYLFTFGKHRLLHQSTGGFIEEKLAGLKTDTALLYPMDKADLETMIVPLQPKTVLLHHFDRWQLPFADGLPDAALGRGRRFARDINTIDKNIKVVIPKYFETYTLE